MLGAKTNARNAVSMVEACYTDTQDYSSAPADQRSGCQHRHRLDQGLGRPVAKDSYTIVATSDSANTFSITKAAGTGQVTRTCVRTIPDGACPTSLKW